MHTALLAVAHLVLPVTLSANFLTCHFDSLDLLATNIFLFSGMTGVSLKALLFVLDRQRFEHLLVRLQETRQQFADNSGARQRCRRLASRLYQSQHSVLQLTVVLWVSVPAATALLSGAGRELPMPLCIPLPGTVLHQSPYFELLYAMQASCLFVAVEAMTKLDASYLTLMLNVAAELEVLNDNLVSLKTSKLPKDENCWQPTDRNPHSPCDPAFEDDMYIQLVKNIKHHQHIIYCARELESVMSGPTLVHLFYSLVCISLSIVSVTVLLQTDGYTPKLLKTTFVIVVFVFELGVFCILGNNVIEQSERLLVSAYSSCWPDANPRFKKALLVFMLRALHPLRISVAKLYPLSKETYLQILNASYTLFNLVFQTNGRN